MDKHVEKFRARRDARLKKRLDEEQWITINGAHVMVDDNGKVTKGPAALKNASKGGKAPSVKSGGAAKPAASDKFRGEIEGAINGLKESMRAQKGTLTAGDKKRAKEEISSAVKSAPAGTTISFSDHKGSNETNLKLVKTGDNKWKETHERNGRKYENEIDDEGAFHTFLGHAATDWRKKGAGFKVGADEEKKTAKSDRGYERYVGTTYHGPDGYTENVLAAKKHPGGGRLEMVKIKNQVGQEFYGFKHVFNGMHEAVGKQYRDEAEAEKAFEKLAKSGGEEKRYGKKASGEKEPAKSEPYTVRSGGKDWDVKSLTKLWRDRGESAASAKRKAERDFAGMMETEARTMLDSDKALGVDGEERMRKWAGGLSSGTTLEWKGGKVTKRPDGKFEGEDSKGKFTLGAKEVADWVANNVSHDLMNDDWDEAGVKVRWSEARERMISRTSKQSSVAEKPARNKYVDDKYFSPMNKAERESDVIDILGKASKDPKVSGWSVKSMADEWMEKRSFDKVERESFIKKLNKAGISM